MGEGHAESYGSNEQKSSRKVSPENANTQRPSKYKKMPSRKGKYNEPYHDGLYRFQDQMFITIGGGAAPSKNAKTSLEAASSYISEKYSHSKDKKTLTKFESKTENIDSQQIYTYGADGKKLKLSTELPFVQHSNIKSSENHEEAEIIENALNVTSEIVEG